MRQEAQAGARSPGLCATAQILNVFGEPWNAIVGSNWFTDSTGLRITSAVQWRMIGGSQEWVWETSQEAVTLV